MPKWLPTSWITAPRSLPGVMLSEKRKALVTPSLSVTTTPWAFERSRMLPRVSPSMSTSFDKTMPIRSSGDFTTLTRQLASSPINHFTASRTLPAVVPVALASASSSENLGRTIFLRFLTSTTGAVLTPPTTPVFASSVLDPCGVGPASAFEAVSGELPPLVLSAARVSRLSSFRSSV